jgi:hypothetical protein
MPRFSPAAPAMGFELCQLTPIRFQTLAKWIALTALALAAALFSGVIAWSVILVGSPDNGFD